MGKMNFKSKLQTLSQQKNRQGPENIVSEYLKNTSTNVNNISTDLKKYKNIHFFQNFKHLKQQQHQIDTLLHKYDGTTNK